MTTTDAPPSADWLGGRALLERHARTGRVFTSNDIRAELVELGFRNPITGRLFQLVEDDGVIRQCGIRRSTGKSAHGAFVREWIGTQAGALDVLIPRGEAVTVPVRRRADGKFTRPAEVTPAGPSLLDYLEKA